MTTTSRLQTCQRSLEECPHTFCLKNETCWSDFMVTTGQLVGCDHSELEANPFLGVRCAICKQEIKKDSPAAQMWLRAHPQVDLGKMATPESGIDKITIVDERRKEIEVMQICMQALATLQMDRADAVVAALYELTKV